MVIKQPAFGALMWALAASSAVAQTATPAPSDPALAVQSVEDCMRAASDLAEAAEAKSLDEDKLDSIEDLLIKMEAHCDAREFAEAVSVAREIQAFIDGD